MRDEDLFRLVLAPGFSTAETATELSGRGVGMDVVSRNIDALRGSIAIASQEGTGSTIALRLPLTLAIIDGFHRHRVPPARGRAGAPRRRQRRLELPR
jgi:two-component system chemotaxis sensor kinase CheA